MVLVEEADDEEEENEEENERRAEEEAERKMEYLKFRRQFDKLKQEVKGVQAESEKIKAQGNNFFKLGLYMQASMMYSEAIELQPDSAVLHCNRSMAYLKQDMPHEALEDAEKSLQIDVSVENIKAYWRKAQALLDLNRSEESEEVADQGLALQASNDHINRVRRKAREASALKLLCRGEWVCKMQNGVEKRYSFQADGTMKIFVFGQFVPATFDLSVECNPRSMRVAMKPEGFMGSTGPPPPPVPYIFDFKADDRELWLCSDPAKLPTEFKGPSFDRLLLVEQCVKVEEADSTPLDVRCKEYIRQMAEVMPMLPPQLPSQPSEKDIGEEVKVMEGISQLKRRYGAEVHQRAIELAKEPCSAGDEELAGAAALLQCRLLARKILADEDCSPWKPSQPTAASSEGSPGARAAAAAPVAAPAAAKPPGQQGSALGCLAGITRCCGGGQ